MALAVLCFAWYSSEPLLGQLNYTHDTSRCVCCIADKPLFENAISLDDQISSGASAAVGQPGTGSAGLTNAGSVTSNLNGFDIQIIPGSNLAANPAALAAFNRAALQWEARISNPITVTINADLAPLGAGILGSASSTMFTGGYNLIRNAVAAQATSLDEAADDAITGFLPTSSTFTATMPTGFSLTGNILATRANLKALGFTALGDFDDASITFSSNFGFDYDNSDGVGAGLFDFESVAAHEIGHALGFVSSVDDIDFLISQNQTAAISLTTLDLFRFVDGGIGVDPVDAATFGTATRNLVPGATAITDFGTDQWGIGSEFLMATGVSNGDGRQASHWKDNLGIGLMDPTLAPGSVVPLTEADFRALDLIGWNIAAIPETSSVLLSALAGICLLRRRRSA
jgi:hypothetical protein